MKTLITLILLLSLSPVSADRLDDCTVYSQFAAHIMSLRQANTDMAEVIQIVQKHDSEEAKMVDMVKDAYEQPAYSSYNFKLRSVKQFKNKYFLSCYKV